MKINEIENNMANYKSHMTVYYSIGDGKIQTIQTGINDMEAVKYVDTCIYLIWNYTIVALDENVIANSGDYIIVNDEIMMRSTKPKYQTIDDEALEKYKKQMEAKLKKEADEREKEKERKIQEEAKKKAEEETQKKIEEAQKQMKEELEKKIRAEFEAQIRAKLEKELREKMEKELLEKMKSQAKPDVQ